MRRLPEFPAKLAAEVRRREPRCARERRHVERLAVASIGEILRAEEMPGRWDGLHRAPVSLAPPSPTHSSRRRLVGETRTVSVVPGFEQKP